MINIVTEYIKYYWSSKRRHGIHSPFVYDFGDKCLNLSVPEEIWEEFLNLRHSFFQNKQIIEVEDLGAGSKSLQKMRKVRDIARVSGINKKYGKLLVRLVSHYPIHHVLELGTSLGLGTYLLAASKEDIAVTTIEGCPNTCRFATENFPLTQKDKVQFINDSFENFLIAYNLDTKFDLVFIDGDHSKKSLFKQLELIEPMIHEETLIVLDDIRWTKDMLEAWNLLKENQHYHLTIDLFRVGIIMKRSHQQKEYFNIRY